MLLTFVAATPFEITPLVQYLNTHFDAKSKSVFIKENLEVHILITGVGMTATAFSMGQYLSHHQPNLCINLGIAGAFKKELKLGDVFNVISDRFGDLGAEDADGSFLDMQALGFQNEEDSLFQNGALYNLDSAAFDFLPKANALTVNKVHGNDISIKRITNKYDVDIESMEGAAFFFACLASKIPFLQIRSISNYVEARDKDKWNIPLAIEKLNEVALSILTSFDVPKQVDKHSFFRR